MPQRHDQLLEQPGNCRRRALAYVGRPEAPFLLRVGSAFQELAERVQSPLEHTTTLQ